MSVGFDSFEQLRAAMIKAVPALGQEGLVSYGALPKANLFGCRRGGGATGAGTFTLTAGVPTAVVTVAASAPPAAGPAARDARRREGRADSVVAVSGVCVITPASDPSSDPPNSPRAMAWRRLRRRRPFCPTGR